MVQNFIGQGDRGTKEIDSLLYIIDEKYDDIVATFRGKVAHELKLNVLLDIF
jgi:hypothetical protein